MGTSTGDSQLHARPISLGKWIGILVLAVVILVPLVGVLYDFHHGSGSDSLLVDITWRVVWIGYTIVRLALIVLLVMAAYRLVKRIRNRPA